MLFYAQGSVPVETYVAVYMENGMITMKIHLGTDPIIVTSQSTLNDDRYVDEACRDDVYVGS